MSWRARACSGCWPWGCRPSSCSSLSTCCTAPASGGSCVTTVPTTCEPEHGRHRRFLFRPFLLADALRRRSGRSRDVLLLLLEGAHRACEVTGGQQQLVDDRQFEDQQQYRADDGGTDDLVQERPDDEHTHLELDA